MKREFRDYQKKKDYLLCVDSDGSAMDTMEIKHRNCFGPCMVEEWGLQAYEEKALWIWNAISLYSIKRGVNRFIGLKLALEYINQTLTPIEDIESLSRWLEVTTELSNAALIRFLEDDDSIILPKVLRWSQSVSQHIAMLPVESRRPYDGVADALMAACEESDVVVVSAANPDALYEEWELHGLAYYVNLILNQNVGTKDFCVNELLAMGYDPDKVIMIGDNVEDLDVARACGIHFYPIILHQAEESWSRFEIEALQRFYDGTYGGAYEQELENAFLQAFKEIYE